MEIAAFLVGLLFICCDLTDLTAGVQLEGSEEPVVQSECRDRYLWIHVTSTQTPHFEAVDGNGVHSLSGELASLCGYTISSFKMDGSTTFRASYYSCFTQNQNDETFTFRFNVIVKDSGGRWINRPVSIVCSGLIWTHREVTCEEDYMEVNMNRESSCGGLQSADGQMWQTALSVAQRTASSVWQLMILKSDGQVSSMSISEAQRQGLSLTTTAQRMVLRSRYKQPHAELAMVDGIPVEVVRVSLYIKHKLKVVMNDVSIACAVNSGSFDGAHLFWDIPRVMSPLVPEGARFESKSLGVGADGMLLDEQTATTRGFSLGQNGNVVHIRVPFGAQGGYRTSLVVNNLYKETYMIFMLYEHIFSLIFEDGTSIDTRHRMIRVLEAPLVCRPPFSLDQTTSDGQMFRVYLGNIPADVILQKVQINGKQLMSQSPEHSQSITEVVHNNGSRAYNLQLPFEDSLVQWMYLGQGVIGYSIDINFTLTIMPQRDPYHHHTVITAQVANAFPPEITAQCSDGGITFSVVKTLHTHSLWEVGVDQEPLTSELAAQRGYILHSDTQRTVLEVPVFSIGYTYEGINLSNFYGNFKLLLRDSKTLEIQTSTSKRCLFKTQNMIVCSADGTMTVVTTPTSTWPTVHPERTTLLDPNCGPKKTDGSRVLFEFRLDSCGTRRMVGESYMVYENEILHDRQIIADGPNFISRDSQFKLTVRCFYPLSGVNRLSVDRLFESQSPGFGSVQVFKSLKEDSENKLPTQACSLQVTGNAFNAFNAPPNQAQLEHPSPEMGGVSPISGSSPQPRPSSQDVIGQEEPIDWLHSPQNLQNYPNFNLLPTRQSPTASMHEVPQQVSSQNNFHNFPQGQYEFPESSVHVSNLHTPKPSTGKKRHENLALAEDNLALGLSSSSGIPYSPIVVEHFDSNSGSYREGSGENVWPSGENVWPSGLTWEQPTLNDLFQENSKVQSLNGVAPSMPEKTELDMNDLVSGNIYSSGGQEMASTGEVAGYQPPSQSDPSLATQHHPVLQPPAKYNSDHFGVGELLTPGRGKKCATANTKPVASKNTIHNFSMSPGALSNSTSQGKQSTDRLGSVERRNTETGWSRVQNVRVKPPSKLVTSKANQKPVIQQANPQISNPSPYVTGLDSERNGGHRASQQILKQKDSKLQEEYEPGKKISTESAAGIQPKYLPQNQQEHQQELAHQVPNQPGHQEGLANQVPTQPGHQQEMFHQAPNQPGHQQGLAHEVPNQPGHQQEPVQVPTQTGHLQEMFHQAPNRQGRPQEPGQVPNQLGSWQTVVKPRAQLSRASHIRVRPVSGLRGIQMHPVPNWQSPQKPSESDKRGEASKTSYPSFIPQDLPNTPVNIQVPQPKGPSSDSEMKPAAMGPGVTGIYMGIRSSGGSVPDLKTHTRSDCSQFSQNEASVHQGIIRGKPVY